MSAYPTRHEMIEHMRQQRETCERRLESFRRAGSMPHVVSAYARDLWLIKGVERELWGPAEYDRAMAAADAPAAEIEETAA